MKTSQPAHKRHGIDRRSLIAASIAVLAVRGVGAAAAEAEIVIVDGWILAPSDLAAARLLPAG
jgi:hypothetical protein